jgi:hypothetical protein
MNNQTNCVAKTPAPTLRADIVEGLPSSGSDEIDAMLSELIENGRTFMHSACESIEADLERSGYYAALERTEASTHPER